MPFKSFEARREYQRKYQREWLAKRRVEWFADKSCVNCGSTKSLELDHIDPSTKVSHNIWSWSAERRDEEVAKCQVLCVDCHMLKSIAAGAQTAHGKRWMYEKYGCRCVSCRQAKSNHNATRVRGPMAEAFPSNGNC